MKEKSFSSALKILGEDLANARRLVLPYLSAPFLVASLYLFALLLAEVLTALVDPRPGLALYGLLFILLLVHASMTSQVRLSKFLFCLALAPLIRLLSLALSDAQYPIVYWYLIVGVPLLVATFLTARYLKFRFVWTAGLDRGELPWQVVMAALGILFGFVGYLILRPDPLIEGISFGLLWVPIIVLLLATGFLEEAIFRGLMQHTSLRYLGIWGIVYVALLFSSMHLIYRSPFTLLFVFAISLLFGFFVWSTGSIMGVSVSHGLMNVFMFLVFPLLIASPKALIRDTQDLLVPPPAGARSPSNPSIPNTGLEVPPTATDSIPTATVCSFPSDWVLYNVQAGDNWIDLSQAYGLRVDELILANCLEGDGEPIPGQWLILPLTPTPALLPVDTQPSAWNPSPSPTQEGVELEPSSKPPSSTPASTLEPYSPSVTPTPLVPTATPILVLPTLTPTISLPTSTPTEELPTALPTDTPTPRSTPSPAPTQPVPTTSMFP